MGSAEFIDLVPERSDVLDALTDGPMGLREVVDRVDTSRSTANRAIRALEDEGLVRRVSAGYETTLAGRVTLGRYRQYRRAMEDLRATGDALDPLSPAADLDSAVLTGGTVTTGDNATPYEPEERLHETGADADAYRGLLPAVDDARHIGLLYEHVVTDGDPADLLVGREVFDHLAGAVECLLSAGAAREAVDAMTTIADSRRADADDETAREWDERALAVARDHGFDAERDRLRDRLE